MLIDKNKNLEKEASKYLTKVIQSYYIEKYGYHCLFYKYNPLLKSKRKHYFENEIEKFVFSSIGFKNLQELKSEYASTYIQKMMNRPIAHKHTCIRAVSMGVDVRSGKDVYSTKASFPHTYTLIDADDVKYKASLHIARKFIKKGERIFYTASDLVSLNYLKQITEEMKVSVSVIDKLCFKIHNKKDQFLIMMEMLINDIPASDEFQNLTLDKKQEMYEILFPQNSMEFTQTGIIDIISNMHVDINQLNVLSDEKPLYEEMKAIILQALDAVKYSLSPVYSEENDFFAILKQNNHIIIKNDENMAYLSLLLTMMFCSYKFKSSSNKEDFKRPVFILFSEYVYKTGSIMTNNNVHFIDNYNFLSVVYSWKNNWLSDISYNLHHYEGTLYSVYNELDRNLIIDVSQ